MPAQSPALLIPAIVLLHGLGHAGAIAALAWIAARPGDPTAGWGPARSWLLPGLAPETATLVACLAWAGACLAFVAAALSLAGVAFPPGAWRGLGALGAVVSLAGIALFAGTWPTFNTAAAVGVNLAVLYAIAARWQPA